MAEPIVSDHALLRYLERVKGVDVESIKSEMLTPTVRMAINAGAQAVKLGCGAKIVIKGATIVTVLP